MSSYWEEFVAAVPWVVEPGQSVHAAGSLPPGSWRAAGPEFSALFPELERLLQRATVTPVTLGEQRHQLFTWRRTAGDRCDWLCPEPVRAPSPELYSEHRVLLGSFGGVGERSNEPDGWLLNHSAALTAAEAVHDATFVRDYGWAFEQAGQTIPIECEDHYAIAREANGNTTLCHRRRGDVLLFAPDHAFDHVTPLPGCPDYTLYTLQGAPSFRDWVRAIAEQQLLHVG